MIQAFPSDGIQLSGSTGSWITCNSLGTAVGTATITNDDACVDLVLADQLISDTRSYLGCTSVTLGPNLVFTSTADVDIEAESFYLENGVSTETGARLALRSPAARRATSPRTNR